MMFDERKVGLNIAPMEFSELQSLCTNPAAFRPSNWLTLFRPWSVFTTPTCLFLAAYKSSICPSLSGSIGRPRFLHAVFSPLPHAHSRRPTRAVFVYPFLGCPSKWLDLVLFLEYFHHSLMRIPGGLQEWCSSILFWVTLASG